MQLADSGLSGPQPGQHAREVFRADVEVFADPSPQHGRGDVAATAFFLRLVQHPQDHALLAREPIAHVGQEVGLRLYGLNSVFSFFFTATPLIFTYSGRPFLYGGASSPSMSGCRYSRHFWVMPKPSSVM